MANIQKDFQFKKIKLNVVIEGERSQMTFEQIEAKNRSLGKPSNFNMGDKIGAYSKSNDIEDFANKFCVLFYPNYKEATFKVNIDWLGVTFWEVPTITKADIFNLTSPQR